MINPCSRQLAFTNERYYRCRLLYGSCKYIIFYQNLAFYNDKTEFFACGPSCVMRAKMCPTWICLSLRHFGALVWEWCAFQRRNSKGFCMSTSYDGWVDKSLHLQNLYFSLGTTEVFGRLRPRLRISKSCPWDAPGRPRGPLRAPWGLSRALLGSLGLSWGCLGVAKQPRADPELGSLRNL